MSVDDGSTMSWQEELASLVETTGIQQYPPPPEDVNLGFKRFEEEEEESIGGEEEESFKDQIKGFLKACGEISKELGKGCKDVLHQTLISHQDSYLITKLRAPLSLLNDIFLPEDRDPLHAWPVVFLVFIIALAVLCVNSDESQTPHLIPKKVNTHPPTATFVHLPDGRRIAYNQRGTLPKTARFSLLSPHSFLSSRLAGIPGIKDSLLQEFGVHLITYDLPGFGESDPHPDRDLNTSASDMLHLVDALVGVSNKFWVAGYSTGGMHAWAALRYIPDRLAGAAMFAPIVNPYDPSMSKEERYGIWEKWTRRKKIMFFLALRFPSLLRLFYRRTFLSGEHGQFAKWLSLSLGKKDTSLVEEATFQEFWERDVEESVRQGNVKPFIEEAKLQVSRWGFSLGDIQVKRRGEKGILPWLKSMYSQVEVEWAGFLGPIHIWQGMDDGVVTARTAEFIGRQIPGATVHKLPGEGHFSYFCFCDECHRDIFLTLFGTPQGPLSDDNDMITISDTIQENEISNISMATASGGIEEED